MLTIFKGHEEQIPLMTNQAACRRGKGMRGQPSLLTQLQCLNQANSKPRWFVGRDTWKATTASRPRTLYNEPVMVMMRSVLGSEPKPTIDLAPSSCVSLN